MQRLADTLEMAFMGDDGKLVGSQQRGAVAGQLCRDLPACFKVGAPAEFSDTEAGRQSQLFGLRGGNSRGRSRPLLRQGCPLAQQIRQRCGLLVE